MATERKHYEAPSVVDYGTVDEVTQGTIAINTGDFPLGPKVVQPIPNEQTSAPVR
jgi:hypothetical protein